MNSKEWTDSLRCRLCRWRSSWPFIKVRFRTQPSRSTFSDLCVTVPYTRKDGAACLKPEMSRASDGSDFVDATLSSP